MALRLLLKFNVDNTDTDTYQNQCKQSIPSLFCGALAQPPGRQKDTEYRIRESENRYFGDGIVF